MPSSARRNGGASGEPGPGAHDAPKTFEGVIDAERRPGEPRWRATARLLERLYPEDFGPRPGACIDVQGPYVEEDGE